MATSTRIKQVSNHLLNRVGLHVDSLTADRLEQERLAILDESGYFQRAPFPLPPCVDECDWQPVVQALTKYREELNRFKDMGSNDVGFTNDNPFYHPPDSDVLYCMIRERRPSRVLEIGSGNSTRLSRQAVIDGQLSTKIISIDPYPRAEIDGCADEIRQQPVERIPASELAEELDAGDFLFIDSSHFVRVGNDCTYEFLQLIPRLKTGVVVHVHDISLPWDYPIEWIRNENVVAEWAEQYLLQAILQASEGFQVLWPGYFVQNTIQRTTFDAWFPTRNGRDARSFWFAKVK